MNNKITMTLNADHLLLQALQEDITSEDITTNSVMRTYQKSSQDFTFLNVFLNFLMMLFR